MMNSSKLLTILSIYRRGLGGFYLKRKGYLQIYQYVAVNQLILILSKTNGLE